MASATTTIPMAEWDILHCVRQDRNRIYTVYVVLSVFSMDKTFSMILQYLYMYCDVACGTRVFGDSRIYACIFMLIFFEFVFYSFIIVLMSATDMESKTFKSLSSSEWPEMWLYNVTVSIDDKLIPIYEETLHTIVILHFGYYILADSTEFIFNEQIVTSGMECEPWKWRYFQWYSLDSTRKNHFDFYSPPQRLVQNIYFFLAQKNDFQHQILLSWDELI